MTDKASLTTLFSETLALGVAANTVIAMRLTKIAFGTVDPKHESALMVAEKLDAAVEASLAAARAFAAGAPHHAPVRAVDVYKRRVERNLRRLTND
jgi:hypothetical protein